MLQASLFKNDEVPEYDKLYYNYEAEASLLLVNALNTKRGVLNIKYILSENEQVSEKLILHVLNLLPTLSKCNVYTFWHYLYKESDYKSFGKALKNYLIKIWTEEQGGTTLTPEYNLHNFDYGDSKTYEEYYNDNLKILCKKNHNKKITIVIDLKFFPSDLKALGNIIGLCHVVSVDSLSPIIDLIVIADNRLSTFSLPFGLNNLIVLRPPSDAIIELLKLGKGSNKRSGPLSEPINSKSDESSAFYKIIQPILYLNRSATLQICDYIKDGIPGAEGHIEQLVEDNILERTETGGLAITRSGLRKYSSINSNSAPKENEGQSIYGTQILNYQTPDKLLRLPIKFNTIEKNIKENFKLIDSFPAVLLNRLNNNGKDFTSSLSYFLDYTRNVSTFKRENTAQHRILLSYLSQLLIYDKYQLGDKFFKLLEATTLGFCGYLESTSENRNKGLFEASRWITNLCYVHDSMCVFHSQKTDTTFITASSLKSASYLQKIATSDVKEYAKTQYSLGWQFFDAGKKSEASQVFYEASLHLLSTIEAHYKSDVAPRDQIYELFFLGFLNANDFNLDLKFSPIYQQFILDNGLFYSLEEIKEFLAQIPLAPFNIGDRFFGVKATVNIYFCKYDIHAAIVISSYLLFRRNTVSNLILVNSEGDINNGITGSIKTHFILGAPDTPNGVGTFIIKNASEATKLYQLKLTDNFHEPEIISAKGHEITILMACGVGGILDCWSANLNKLKLPQKSITMDAMILSSILIPILKTARDKVTQIFVEKLVKKVSEKLPGGNAKVNQELGELKQEIQSFREELIATKDTSSVSVYTSLTQNKSPLLLTALGELSKDQNLVQILSEVLNEMRKVSLAPEELLNLSETLIEVAMFIGSNWKLSISESDTIQGYQEVFRNYYTDAQDFIRNYTIFQTLDKKEYNGVITRFYGSADNFLKYIGQKKL